MTVRALAPDTDADIQIREILDSNPTPSFSVIAGAGSGKTTSLVKALSHVAATKGESLKARTQQIACITYTEVAAEEIYHEAGSHPLIFVSTIHSFLWKVIAPFQTDIGRWVQQNLEKKIAELDEVMATGSPRRVSTAAATREKRIRQLAGAKRMKVWIYGVGGDYGRGIVGHSDVLSMVPELLSSRPLLCKVVASKFPIIFVDESQDTVPGVLDALLHLRRSYPERVCLGLFGDPMQRIHFGGISEMPREEGWKIVEKPENFRSSLSVLNVINHIRSAADGLQQVSGLSPERIKQGEAFFFVLPSDGERTANLELVRKWLDDHSSSGKWTSEPPSGAKILLIMHKLAARRLGFGSLYEAFHQSGSGSLGEMFDEGTSWPLTPLLNVILPLCDPSVEAVPAASIRKNGAILSDETLASTPVTDALRQASNALKELRAAAESAGPGSIGKVLRIAHDANLVSLDPRLVAFLDSSEGGDIALPEPTKMVLQAFMECDLREIDGYVSYINRSSPYSTQHGTKGAEFSRVIVVLDDNEESWSLYSYEKLLGLRPLSKTDRNNQAEGRESVIERTRRLLYVCASRARDSLAVVLYVEDTQGAVHSLISAGYSGADQIYTLQDIASPVGCESTAGL